MDVHHLGMCTILLVVRLDNVHSWGIDAGIGIGATGDFYRGCFHHGIWSLLVNAAGEPGSTVHNNSGGSVALRWTDFPSSSLVCALILSVA